MHMQRLDFHTHRDHIYNHGSKIRQGIIKFHKSRNRAQNSKTLTNAFMTFGQTIIQQNKR